MRIASLLLLSLTLTTIAPLAGAIPLQWCNPNDAIGDPSCLEPDPDAYAAYAQALVSNGASSADDIVTGQIREDASRLGAAATLAACAKAATGGNLARLASDRAQDAANAIPGTTGEQVRDTVYDVTHLSYWCEDQIVPLVRGTLA